MVDKEQLTVEELDSVLEFADALYNNYLGNYAMFNPYSSNDNLIRINNNPLRPTEDKLEDALSKVPYDNELVSRYSEFMQTWDSIYNKTLSYYKSLLSYDLSWVCTNASGSDYASKEYQDDLKRLYKFFDRFDYKSEFDKVTDEVLKKGASFLWFRDSQPIDQEIDIEAKRSEAFGLQIMPDKYCKITAFTSNGLPLYDFDINYFLHSNVDIKLFSPSLIKKFKTAYGNSDVGNYFPHKTIDNRNGTYGGQWVQTSYNDGAYCVKWGLGNYRVVPPFASLMKNCIGNDTIKALQLDKDMISAWYLLAGEIKTIDNAKTDKADQFKIAPKTMGKFMSLVNSGIKGNVKPILMPAENIRGWSFTDQNPSMYKNQLMSASGQGASASELIYHDSNLSQFAMQNAIETDYAIIKPLYEQYAHMLDIFVNKKTRKYKFKFNLTGLDRSWHRKERLDAIKGLSEKGMTLGDSQWASCLGMNPCDFARSLEEAHNSNFTNNLTLLMNANTMNSEDGSTSSDNGRPKEELLDRSDKTEEVEDYVS